MPNVAGVQFPYTPQGVQAAQLYQRSLSPRRGLGFRPIRMAEGSTPEHENALIYIKWAHGEGSDSLPREFQINDLNFLAQLIVTLENDPEAAIKYKEKLQRAIETPVSEGIAPPTTAEEVAFGATAGTGAALAATGLGRQEALRAMGESNPIIAAADEQIAQNMMDVDQGVATGLGRQPDLRAMTKGFDVTPRGPAPERAKTMEFPYPINPETGLPWTEEEIGPVVRAPKESGEDYPSRGYYEGDKLFGTKTMEYVPKRDDISPWLESFTPGGPVQGMRYGGVPRGTVAGELEPRGYLTARQAGKTMRERAKGLRDPRRYGGIGSLYNRYG